MTALPGRAAVVWVILASALLLPTTPATARTLQPIPSTASPAQPIATPDAAVLLVEHPALPLRYEVLPEVLASRVVLQTLDVTAPGRPRVIDERRLHAVTSPRSVAVDAAGNRLYVAVGTNTHVLDLADPRMPAPVGRMSDYMVRSHEQVQTMIVNDPVFGTRELLAISSRLGGRSGCWTGTLHVYDITGQLRDAPVAVLESDVPVATTLCPTPSLRVNGEVRRLSVTWSGGGLMRRDHVPFDVTTAFAELVGVCPLARPV